MQQIHPATQATLLADARNTLGEGATWCDRTHALYWVDIEGAQLWRCRADGSDLTPWAMPERLACFALTDDPDVLLVGRDASRVLQSAQRRVHADRRRRGRAADAAERRALRRFRRVRVRDEGRGQRAAARGGRVLSAQCRSHARTAGVARGRDREQHRVLAGWREDVFLRFAGTRDFRVRLPCGRRCRERAVVRAARRCRRRPGRLDRRSRRRPVECAVGRQAGGALRAGRCRDGSHRGADRAAELHGARRRRPPVRDERAHRVERRCVGRRPACGWRVRCADAARGLPTARFAGTPRG